MNTVWWASKMVSLKLFLIQLICLIGIITASPASPILRKLDSLRYQYAEDGSGQQHLVDLWMSLDDISESARYNPVALNVYHLFTRSNPTVSQPLLHGNEAILGNSNFNRLRRTIFIAHGWRDSASSEIIAVLVPAILAAEDVNVIALDWSAGAGTIVYPTALENAITCGGAVAQFIDWLNGVTGSNSLQYHLVGHGLGGHLIGVAGRRSRGDVSYITSLDPSMIGWVNHPDRLHDTDSLYTEVIHTNSGFLGYLNVLGHVDFYPNGGESMPGCDTHPCDHAMSYRYFAESVRSGGFTGTECSNVLFAIAQLCRLPTNLRMGGLVPKTGSHGIFAMATNASPPYSRG